MTLAINNFFSSVRWKCLMDDECADDATQLFYNIEKAIDLFVPQKTINKSNLPNSFSPELKDLVTGKELLMRTI